MWNYNYGDKKYTQDFVYRNNNYKLETREAKNNADNGNDITTDIQSYQNDDIEIKTL